MCCIGLRLSCCKSDWSSSHIHEQKGKKTSPGNVFDTVMDGAMLVK